MLSPMKYHVTLKYSVFAAQFVTVIVNNLIDNVKHKSRSWHLFQGLKFVWLKSYFLLLEKCSWTIFNTPLTFGYDFDNCIKVFHLLPTTCTGSEHHLLKLTLQNSENKDQVKRLPLFPCKWWLVEVHAFLIRYRSQIFFYRYLWRKYYHFYVTSTGVKTVCSLSGIAWICEPRHARIV